MVFQKKKIEQVNPVVDMEDDEEVESPAVGELTKRKEELDKQIAEERAKKKVQPKETESEEVVEINPEQLVQAIQELHLRVTNLEAFMFRKQ